VGDCHRRGEFFLVLGEEKRGVSGKSKLRDVRVILSRLRVTDVSMSVRVRGEARPETGGGPRISRVLLLSGGVEG